MTTTTTDKPEAEQKGKEKKAEQKLAFTCTAGNLTSALAIALRAVPSKSTLPVLGCVHLVADGDAVRLTGTDLNLRILASLDADADDEGECCVDAHKLSDWVKLFDDDARIKATLKLHGKLTSKLHLKCGSAELELSVIDASDFPPGAKPKEPESQQTAKLPARLLREMIDQVAFAAAPDDTRPVLSGIYVRIDADKRFVMAAADGFRLAVREVSLNGSAKALTPIATIIPHKALKEVARILDPEADDEDEKTEPVSLTWWTKPQMQQKGNKFVESTTLRELDSSLVLSIGNVEIQTRLIDGQFPEYTRIIPASYSCDVQVETKRFLRAVKGAISLARDNSNIVRLKIEPEGIDVSGTSAEMGKANDVVPFEKIKVDGWTEIAFNGRYLLDLLAEMPELLRLQCNGTNEPGSFIPVGKLDGLQYIVMPMHVAR